MPNVFIEVRKEYPKEQEIALMQAVYSALQQAFKVSDEAISVRLIIHEPHRFSVPLMHQFPDLYTHVSIDCYTGRSLETKRDLYQKIV